MFCLFVCQLLSPCLDFRFHRFTRFLCLGDRVLSVLSLPVFDPTQMVALLVVCSIPLISMFNFILVSCLFFSCLFVWCLFAISEAICRSPGGWCKNKARIRILRTTMVARRSCSLASEDTPAWLSGLLGREAQRYNGTVYLCFACVFNRVATCRGLA